MKNRLLFLGPPGAGKGTQAARLCDANSMKHLSTGDLLRSEVAAGSDLGKEAEAVMNRGELVSDALVLAIVESQMKALTTDGWLLDGFPRTVPQAEALEPLLAELQQPIQQPAIGGESLHLAFHNRQHKGVAHQFAAVHHRFSFFAQIAACCYFRAQQIARGQMLHAVGIAQPSGLGAFAGSGRAKKEQAIFHGCVSVR